MRRFTLLCILASGLLPAAALGGTAAGVGAMPAMMAVTLQRHDAGTFYIPAAIEGYGEVELLVDTGASYLVINQNILDALLTAQGAEFSHQLSGVMADGSHRVIPVYRLAAVRLGADCWVRDVEAAVFPGDSRPILGMNILARLAPFTFSAEPPQLALAQCQAAVSGGGLAASAAVLQR